MKSLFRSCLFFLLAWFVADRTGALLMSEAYQATHYDKARKLREIADSVQADVVLFGTSRCEYHYVPSIISDSLGLSVYNAGINASSNIYSQFMALVLLLQHHTPKVVCLDTGESEFAMGENDFDPLGIFAPFFGRCAEADSLFAAAGLSPFYALSHLYRYHTNADLVLGGLFAAADPEEDAGFHPLPQPERSLAGLVDSPPVSTDSLKLRQLGRFIELCHQRQITVVLSISPSMARIAEDYYGPLRDVARQYDVVLLDYDTPNLYGNRPEYFRDSAHLTGCAARLFSSLFAADLKRTLCHHTRK